MHAPETDDSPPPTRNQQHLMLLRLQLFTAWQVLTDPGERADFKQIVHEIAQVCGVDGAMTASSPRPLPGATAADRDLVVRAVAHVANAHAETELSPDAILMVVTACALDPAVDAAFRRIIDQARALAASTLAGGAR